MPASSAAAIEYHEREPIDVESLIQWAISKTGNLPWTLDDYRELAFDRGLTARPRRRPPATWMIATACAGIRFHGRGIRAKLNPIGDAHIVVEAIKALPPQVAALVIRCGREKIRPEYAINGIIEPELIVKKIRYKRRKNGKRKNHRPITQTVWNVDPATIRAVRKIYTAWRGGLVSVERAVSGTLEDYSITGIMVEEEPWTRTS